MNEMYNRIEGLCKEKGISITKMCKLANVSRAPLTELKMNRTQKLSVENAEKIAAFFGVTVSYLLGTETKKSPSEDGDLAEYLSELRDRPEMRMLFHTFKGATKEQIEAIVAAWEAMNGRKE